MKNYLRKIAALAVTGAMSAGAVLPLTAMADEVITLTATATDGNSFLFMNSEITVAADESESYGYTDNVTDGVSTLDVLVKMHEEKYGESFTAETASDYLAVSEGGWLSTAFEQSASTGGYYLNGSMPSTLVNETPVSEDDLFEFMFYQDTVGYSDYYKHIADFSAFLGEEVTINAGASFLVWGMYPMEITGEYVQLGYVENDGTITPIEEADENGDIKVSFDTKGTYYVTLFGSADDSETPVIPSVTKVTVLPCEKDVFEKLTTTQKNIELTYGREWDVLGLVRAGYAIPDTYYETVIENTDEILKKATEVEKAIIVASAMNKVPDEKLLSALSSKSFVQKGGVMSSIYGLIAVDTKSYEIPENEDDSDQNTREVMIDDILAHQIDDGGFAFSVQWGADIDTTAMAVQALARYRTDTEVAAALEKALEYIAVNVEDANVNSLAQVIVAYISLDMDAGEYVEKMLESYDGNGSFTYNGSANAMATQQGYYALVDYMRWANGENSLYDITDVYYEISEAGTIYAPFETDAEIVCAAYNDGIFTGTTLIPVKLCKGTNNVEGITENSKVMLWSSKESMEPLCEAFE